jgi:hypothetical protein
MTPCLQLVSHVPSRNQYGDCTRTCVAALLDLQPELVPHFAEFSTTGFNEAEYRQRIDDFLTVHGLMWVAVPIIGSVADVLATMEHNNPGVYYIMGCRGPIGGHHLVWFPQQIVSDPAGRTFQDRYRADDSGLVWVSFLVPIRFKSSS